MAPTTRLGAVSLALSMMLLLGCKRDESREQPVANKGPAAINNQDALQQEIANQLAKQMAKREEDLEKHKLVLLVDSIRDDVAVKAKAAQLIEKKGSYSILTRGGPGGTISIEVSPVAEVTETADRIDFGAVLAVDVEKRILSSTPP